MLAPVPAPDNSRRLLCPGERGFTNALELMRIGGAGSPYPQVGGRNYPTHPLGVVHVNNLLTSLVAYYSLEESSGSSATDATGRGNTLTDNSTVGSGTGKVANCRTFVRATPTYLSRADNADLSLGAAGSFSISAWYYLTTVSGALFNTIVGKFDEANAKYGYYIVARPDNSQIFQAVGKSGGFTSQANGGIFQSATTWYHVVLVHDEVAQLDTLYFNGTAQTPKANTFAAVDDTADFNIGRVVDANLGATRTCPFGGSIDEVALWKKALTSTDVSNLYNSGNGLAYSSFD